MCRGHEDPADGPLAFSPLFTISQYDSLAQMEKEGRQDIGFGSAQCVSRDGSVVVFIADVSGIGDRSDAVRITAKSMQPLDRFGRTINEAAASTRRPSVAAPAPVAPPAAAPAPAPPTRVSTVTPDSQLQWRFQSRTGNIACQLDGSSSPPEATCEVREHTYQPPVKKSCDPGWANSFTLKQGQTVEVNCYSGTDFRDGLPVQDYGRPLTVGSLTCVLDENTGVNCKDSTMGHYIQAARQAYEWR